MKRSFLLLCLPVVLFFAVAGETLRTGQWTELEAEGSGQKRHEHAFVKVGGHFYALGGRRIQAVDIFDPATSSWTQGALPPVELHHFQALEYEGKVLVAGAFTGRFPGETPVPNLYFYHPASDTWEVGPEIPEARRRGSAGAFLREGKLYLVSGLIDGHRSGWVPWFDVYNFETGEWNVLPDAPRSRDHFQAVLLDDQVVLAGGRRSGEGGNVFRSVIPEVDVYDFAVGEWRTLPAATGNLPTPRAGTSALEVGGKIVIIGGESERKEAHSEVEALDLASARWVSWPPLPGGRHATQPILHQGAIYLQAGSVTRGGTETASLIRCPVEALSAIDASPKAPQPLPPSEPPQIPAGEER